MVPFRCQTVIIWKVQVLTLFDLTATVSGTHQCGFPAPKKALSLSLKVINRPPLSKALAQTAQTQHVGRADLAL